jgi:hypothetical protein
MLTREQIMERLKADSVTLGTSDTDFWSSAVPESKMRYIVLIQLHGDGVASRTVDIEKKEETGSYTVKFDDIPVSPADTVPLPPHGYDIENPILVLEGGANLAGKVSAGSGLNATVVYWDNDI